MGLCMSKPPTLERRAPQTDEVRAGPSNITPQLLNNPGPAKEDEKPVLKEFTNEDLHRATNGFRQGLILPPARSSRVYKCSIENYGQVAVREVWLSYEHHDNFRRDAEYLHQLRHPDLVKLIGYCAEGDRTLLVHEYMGGGCLKETLYDQLLIGHPWSSRLQIAKAVARGLTFLHGLEPQVIHGNFSTSKVLMDRDYNPKLSIVRVLRAGEWINPYPRDNMNTMGASAHLAPEYVNGETPTTKCDVYSYGVFLLELLTGRPAIDKDRGIENYVEWIQTNYQGTKGIFNILDHALGGSIPEDGVWFLAQIANRCVNKRPIVRPSMHEIVEVLEKVPTSRDDNNPTHLCPYLIL